MPSFLEAKVAVKLVIGVALRVAPDLTTKISLPVPKSEIVSVPESILNVSLPVPPANVSLPAPPVITSAPLPPVKLSVPAPPVRVKPSA